MEEPVGLEGEKKEVIKMEDENVEIVEVTVTKED